MLRFIIIGLLCNITYTFELLKINKRESPILFGSVPVQNENSKINTPLDKDQAIENNERLVNLNSDNQNEVVGSIAKNPFASDIAEHAQKSKKSEQDEVKPNKSLDVQAPKVDKKESTENKATSTKNVAKQTVNNTVINSGNKSSTLIPFHVNKEDVIQSGALLRGFYVFLGLSILTMLYFIFRSYRLRRGSQPPSTVRKYGITARRSDMEMRPLELEEDDDDTLFEIGNQNTTNR